jgi:ADP-ribosylglycohydrolase
LNQSERIIGCILGGAIGDCRGGPYEGNHSRVVDARSGDWRLSDDTQLTLATCEAITTTGKIEPASIAASFVSWFKESRLTGMGSATYKAVTELAAGGHWALVGRQGEMSAGNGAAMRIAPLAFCLDPKDAETRTTIRDVCRITHHNDEAYAGALAVLLAIRAVSESEWNGSGNLLGLLCDQLPDTKVKDSLLELSTIEAATPIRTIAERFGSSGYVAESVPLSLFGVQSVGRIGFDGMINELIAAGGDTDTVASIAGQIAGTVLGRRGLPPEMVERLPGLAFILDTAEQFSKVVANMLG